MIFSSKLLFANIVALCMNQVLAQNLKASACIYPKGLGDDSPHSVPLDWLNFPQDPSGVFGAFIDLVIPSASSYETPVQFRNIQWAMVALWGTFASHHPKALDIFGREATSRRCIDTPLLLEHRLTSFAYAFAYSSEFLFPSAQNDMMSLLSQFGLDPLICGHGKDDCTDTTTPWGLAFTLVEENREIARVDGWNSDGSFANIQNRVPYSDWREKPYVPDLNARFNWKPLVESNGRGYLTRQEHVTPHIGQTGKSLLLGDDKICKLTAPAPQYDYDVEIEKALRRSADLDDFKKMEIELFDSKLTSVVPLTAQYYIRLGKTLDSFEFIYSDAIIISALYEATLVAWKEKISFDAIRPPTLVRAEKAGETVEAYAGPYQGTKRFNGKDWQPYIRTMPHAEYPSASACVCEAAKEVMIALTGSDDVTKAINGPLGVSFEAGSSFTEPGLVPAESIGALYSSWSEVANACGQSRLNGGMHFEASVPNAADLCRSIGTDIVEAFDKLVNGIVPDHVLDLDKGRGAPPKEVRCQTRTVAV